MLGVKVTKPALILKNADGKYDRIAVYLSKDETEPLYILENDVYSRNCPDIMPTKTGVVQVVRNMRALEIAEDGTYVRLWGWWRGKL